jgi:hypothetical protein
LQIVFQCKCVLLPLKLSVGQSNRPYDLKKHLFCHAPGPSVLGSPRSSEYRNICVQTSTTWLPEPTPLTMRRAVPSSPPPLWQWHGWLHKCALNNIYPSPLPPQFAVSCPIYLWSCPIYLWSCTY